MTPGKLKWGFSPFTASPRPHYLSLQCPLPAAFEAGNHKGPWAQPGHVKISKWVKLDQDSQYEDGHSQVYRDCA